MLRFILFVFLFSCAAARAQEIVITDSVLVNGVRLDRGWKFSAGDDPEWAKPAFDDSSWDTVSSTLDVQRLRQLDFKGIGWLRLHFKTDSSLNHTPLGLVLQQQGASEIYIDGRLVLTNGTVSADAAKEERMDPKGSPVIIGFREGDHVMAVRYSNHSAFTDAENYQTTNAGFWLSIGNPHNAIAQKLDMAEVTIPFLIFLFTFFVTLSFLHLLLFLFNRSLKSNLYYCLFSFLLGFIFLIVVIEISSSDPAVDQWFLMLLPFIPGLMLTAMLALVYSFFKDKMPRVFWLMLGITIAGTAVSIYYEPAEIFIVVWFSLLIIETLRVVIASIYRKKPGAWIVGAGVISFGLLVLIFMLVVFITGEFSINTSNPLLWLILGLVVLGIISIPISMSVYLARNYALVNRNLKLQLVQIQDLSAKTLQQEQEKKRILETQKEELERTVAERTAEVVLQKKEIEEKNKNITDSITYAKRIQQAILPHSDEFGRLLPDSFVFYLPKDIVSGDFYWISRKEGYVLVAAADCTGHGVPGAFMSMIGNALLNEIVNEKGITSPEAILNQLHISIRQMLKQDQQHGETRDGMDMAICRIDLQKRTVDYAGAMRPVYIVSDNEGRPQLTELKADKHPIGGIQDSEERKFTLHRLQLKRNDMIFLSSDGFADQFGGERGKKFMVKKFQQLLIDLYHLPLKEQQAKLHAKFEEWRGSHEQVDDVLVIGIRI